MCSCVVRISVTLGCFLTAAAACADEAISVELTEADGGAVISVGGLEQGTLAQLHEDEAGPPELGKLLAVYAGEQAAADQPAVLGSVRMQGDHLVFRPRFPFKPGMAYRVVFRPQGARGQAKSEGGDGVVERIVRLQERAAGEPTVVEAVHPAGDVLPENVLKFYVHFSAPMSQGKVYEHVRLLDDRGREVEHPFVNLGQELWDRSGTRVTLLLDPGRIKRGLRPREEVGPILEEGRAYELVIDGAWRDAHGRPLAEAYRKSFRAAAPDDVQPDPTKWRITSPSAGTSAPLTIRFEEPLDHAMLNSSFAVLTERQTPLAGTIQVDDGETVWRFVPESQWAAGDYLVVVDTSLEDRSGNSIERPFEVDVFEKVQAEVIEKSVSLPLRILLPTQN